MSEKNKLNIWKGRMKISFTDLKVSRLKSSHQIIDQIDLLLLKIVKYQKMVPNH